MVRLILANLAVVSARRPHSVKLLSPVSRLQWASVRLGEATMLMRMVMLMLMSPSPGRGSCLAVSK